MVTLLVSGVSVSRIRRRMRFARHRRQVARLSLRSLRMVFRILAPLLMGSVPYFVASTVRLENQEAVCRDVVRECL